MAQRESKQSVQAPGTRLGAASSSARAPLTPEERERIDTAVSMMKTAEERDTMRWILENYWETFEYLKDK